MGVRDLIQRSAGPGDGATDEGFAAGSEPMPGSTESQNAEQGLVCIVDDDVWVRESLSMLLEAYGYTVLSYASGAGFLYDARRRAAKFLVIDQHMPALNGFDVVRQLRRDGDAPPTILITGRIETCTAQRAGELGIRAVLEKPFRVTRLVELISDVIAPPLQHGR